MASSDDEYTSDPSLLNPTANHTNSSAATPSFTPATLAMHKILQISSVQKPIQTELVQSPPNYRRWRQLFTVALGKYNLLSHIDGSPPSQDENWSTLDFTVQSWIYATVSDDILQFILRDGASARDIWVTIAELFQDNKPSRAIQLESDFRGLKQGNLSIGDYCLRLKVLADGLADVDSPVSDANLVLQMVSGLNETYATMASVLTNQKPFPSFQQARSSLILDESRRRNLSPPATALNATIGNPSTGNTGFTNDTRGGKGKGRFAGKNKGKFNNHNKGTSLREQLYQLLNIPPQWRPPPQWPPAQQPSAGPGILGPAPPSPATGQAFLQQTSTSGPSWDQQSLINALNALSVSSPTDPQWYMDSGASSHMTNGSGSSNQDRDKSLQ